MQKKMSGGTAGGPDRFTAVLSCVEPLRGNVDSYFLTEVVMRQSAVRHASNLPVAPNNDQDRSIKSKPRGRPRSEESEEAILAATIQLLLKKPLRDISMEEIARNAGVGKATIYKWWPSKAYVALDAFLRKANRMLPTPDTGSVRSDILEQIRALMVFYQSPAGHIMGQFIAESQIDREFALLFRKLFLKPRREAVGVMFDRGVERGEIEPSLDRELVLDLMIGSAIFRMIVGHAPIEAKIADQMVAIIFEGLDNRSRVTGAAGAKIARKNGVSRGKTRR
jgi:AcrR family transcriptional regulator